jgi:hypothetical protein
MPEAVRAKPQPLFGSFLAVQKGTRVGTRNISLFIKKSHSPEGELFPF